MSQESLLKAAATWNVDNESIDQVNQRIHDGVPAEKLDARADGYIAKAFSLFPYVTCGAGRVLEIGSGMGFIMEAMDRFLQPKLPHYRITGLDISKTMIEKAKLRLAQSFAYQKGRLDFAAYDGITIPFEDNSFDIVYSVAALQHVPKPYVYHLFFEIKRVLKPDGYALINLLPFQRLTENYLSWREEIDQQVGLAPSGHWHHYYTKQELDMVLAQGTGLPHVDVVNEGAWTCFRKTPLSG
jgi:SAM-dependent methyltransferase